MNVKRTALDPFRALIGVLEKRGDSHALRAAANSSGLIFDSSLSERDAFSHTTRIRALVPRILKAYDALDDAMIMARRQDAERQFRDAIDADPTLRAAYAGLHDDMAAIQQKKTEMGAWYGAFRSLESAGFSAATLRRAQG